MQNMSATKKGPGRRPQFESIERYEKPEQLHIRDFSGAKLARKITDGKASMRHVGGIVSQTFREMAQRKFREQRAQ